MVPHEENYSLIQEALERFRRAGDPVGEGLTLLFASLSEYVTRGSVDAGLGLIEECDRVVREIGAPQLVAHIAEIRAFFLGLDGRLLEAAPLMREAVNLYAQVRDPNCGAHFLENVALLLCDQQPENALELLAATERLRAEIGVPPPPYENLGFTDANARARSLLAPHQADVAWQRGTALDFDGAVRVADELVSRLVADE